MAKVRFAPCEACGDRGYLLVDKDHSGHLEIQRCDTCGKFNSDNRATEACYEHATRGWEFLQAARTGL